jgi:hypothetical protein
MPAPVITRDSFRPRGLGHGPSEAPGAPAVPTGASSRQFQGVAPRMGSFQPLAGAGRRLGQVENGYLDLRVVDLKGDGVVGAEVTLFWPDATHMSYYPDKGKAVVNWVGNNFTDEVIDVVLTPPSGWRTVDGEYAQKAVLSDYWQTTFVLEPIPPEGTPGAPEKEGERAVGGAVSTDTLYAVGGAAAGAFLLALILSG